MTEAKQEGLAELSPAQLEELRVEFTKLFPEVPIKDDEQLRAYAALKEVVPSDGLRDIFVQFISAPADQKIKNKLLLLGEEIRAKGVCEKSYLNLYWCVTRRKYPVEHLPLLRGLLRAYKREGLKPGVMIMAWRGFGKSTDLLVWCLLLIGCNPVGSTAFIRINNDKAKESGSMIAEIIEKHEAWKACFPHVVPDTEKGWSIERGYFVMDTRVTGTAGKDTTEFQEGYAKWRQMCFADHQAEPTLTCAGVESGTIIGLHSTLGQWFDDLHDERNTKSMTEMKGVVDILEGNLIPTWFAPDAMPILGCVCTPWDSDNDAYAAMLRTGLFELVKIPIMRPLEIGVDEAALDVDGAAKRFDGAVVFEPLQMKVKLTWPSKFPLEKVKLIYGANIARFMQMYMLDDRAARHLRKYVYQQFENQHIKWHDWQIGGGCDPVYKLEQMPDKKGTHYFALAYLLITPLGTGIIGDGVMEKCSASQGMGYIARAQTMFANWLNCYSEVDAGNAAFIQLSIGYPGVRVIPFKLSDIAGGRMNKASRQYAFLEKPLRDGLLQVSDAKTPFLETFRSYLSRFPNFPDDAPEWDVADAVVAALYGRPQVWKRAGVELDGSPAHIVSQRQRARRDPTAGLAGYSYLNKR